MMQHLFLGKLGKFNYFYSKIEAGCYVKCFINDYIKLPEILWVSVSGGTTGMYGGGIPNPYFSGNLVV